MALQGFGFEALPGDGARTTFPGEPETREDNNTITPHGRTRRRLILAGGATLVLAGAGAAGYFLLNKEIGATDTETPPEPTKTDALKPRGDFEQVPRVFFGPNGEPMELTREQITMPETLDPPTFEEAFANVAQAIQYYVNNGDLAGIQTVIPGTTDPYAMSPGQLYERAKYIEGHRKMADGLTGLYDSNPENHPQHYAWGLHVKLLEQLTELGAKVEDTEMVKGRVEVAVGDFRPNINGNNRIWSVEKPRTYEGTMTITRYANIGLNARLPNNGWGVYQMSFPIIPNTIAEHPPKGYEQTPPLYPIKG